jgi:hypothetical protein
MNRITKDVLLIWVAALSQAACTPQNTTPVMPVVKNTALDTTKAQLLKKGMFVGLDGPTSGTAAIYNQSGTIYVLLSPFQSHAGPDLKVYVSKDADANDYVRLGDLQAVTGRQVYVVPGGITIADYNFVHIWCQKYSLDFARAQVK